MLKAFSALLCLLVLVASPSVARDVDATVFSDPAPIAEVKLQDHMGKRFDLASLKGRWSIVFLGYTHCPDVCPFTLGNLAAVLKSYREISGPSEIPQVIFLSVDPDRDSVTLADYIAYFDPAFVGITGERSDIDALVTAIDGFYKLEKAGDDDDAYEVSHSASVAVVSPEGRLQAKINPPFPPMETAEFLKDLLTSNPIN